MSKLNNLKQNVPLAPFTTFKIGGPAKYFVIVKNEEEMINALKWAKENKVQYFILGHGANILISDDGFDGIVIKNEMKRVEIRDDEIFVESGLLLSNLIVKCASKGLGGLEFLSGIPSSVGGAVFGNAGAPDQSIGDYIKKVKVLDKQLRIKDLNKSDCAFAYRQSAFQKDEYIILSVTLRLEKGEPKIIQDKIKKTLLKKKTNQPLEFPSAGCVFKNPAGFSAGQLIDELDLKSKKIGQAQISEKHANYIINLGGAKADQVVQLICYIKQQVRDKKGVPLCEEIKYIGF